jgi:hypothetical protein
MRKGEPKTSLGLTSSAFQRNAGGPELPHATRMPSGALPAGYPLLFNPRFHSNQCAQSIQVGLRCSNPHVRPNARSNAKSPGGRLMGIRCRGLGKKSVPGKLAGMKGKPLLTSKSLSANPVYHTFAFYFSPTKVVLRFRERRLQLSAFGSRLRRATLRTLEPLRTP